MTRRIFRNILLTAVLALLLSSALLVGTLYNVYEGRISAVGTHDELYATNKDYRKMVDLQKLEEEGGVRHA